MSAIVLPEVVCAVFMGIVLIYQFAEYGAVKSERVLRINTAAIIIWLGVDAWSFATGMSWLPTFLADTWGNIVSLIFIIYCKTYMGEKVELNRWTFRIPAILCVVDATVAAILFITGNLVAYEQGVMTEVYNFPLPLLTAQTVAVVYPAVVAVIKGKSIGRKGVILFALFGVMPILGTAAFSWSKIDYTVVLCSVAQMIIVVFLQNERRQDDFAEHIAHKALAENSARFFALEDDFESLYDVELETGRYISYERGDFYRNNVSNRLVTPTDFFTDIHENIKSIIYEEDRAGVEEYTSRETIIRELSQKDHFDHYYRINTANEPSWLKMRIVYKDEQKKNIIVGVFNAAEEMAFRQKEEQQHRNTELQLRHEQLRGEILRYMVTNDDDPIELLKNYAEHLRELMNCDQISYRTLDETRFMINSAAVESGGYTIKSSLTGTLLCDGERVGVLAAGTIQDSYLFSDLERETFEFFVRVLSLSLSRFKAKQQAGELNDVKRTLNMMFSLSDQFDPIIVLDPVTGEYDWYQSRAQEIEEKTSMTIHGDDLYKNIGIDSASIIHEDDREQYKAFYTRENMMKIAETGESQETENRWLVGDGGTYLWKYNKAVRMVDENGKVYVVVGVVDTTEKKQKEEQLQETYAQLKEARIQAEAANKAKSNFLFNMSHDIRTPMNAIKGFTTMAKKNAGDEKKVVEYLDKIDISGEQLLKLINQVLEMARIESGKITLEERPVSIQEEFNSMVTVLAEEASEKGLKFSHSLSDVTHDKVLADEARMSSITLNISGNAMKYTPQGGSVSFELREIKSRKPGYATFVFTVADTGIGMSKEYLNELYEPFSREKSSTVSKIQGTGLGLSIVKTLVDLMGGDIEVHSEPDKGTRFDITIDFKINEAADKVTEEESLSLDFFKGRRVLLVEDNEFNREIASDFLEDLGISVETAEDGTEAVAKVQTIADRGEFHYYDFILMDIQMPKMNGYDATRAIRAIPGPDGVHIPIIAMTANAFEEDRQNALAAGMDEHLAKPIDSQKMMKTIAKFLK